jgi:hypothetical protein
MDENPGLSDQYRRASPWPVFVALGIPISELGILFDVFPVAVGGLLLFCGSVAGMTQESGYAATPWRPLIVMAGLCVAAGAALAFTDLQYVTRGYAIIAAGVLMLAGAVLGPLVVQGDARAV